MRRYNILGWDVQVSKRRTGFYEVWAYMKDMKPIYLGSFLYKPDRPCIETCLGEALGLC